jgi:hypothetical protein
LTDAGPIPLVFRQEENTTMPRTIHALLVAIDDYPNPIPSLQGCVNDIDAFAAWHATT